MLRAKDELSRAVGAPLAAAVGALPDDAVLVAAGTSCRHQVEHRTGRHALHPAELLAAAIRPVDGVDPERPGWRRP
jgi:Fe-S oxidoreductase